jgi:enoyl-CoA hydratase/carnithine racemase
MKRIELAGYQAKHFQYTVAGKVATITLNRPDRKNPLTFDSYGELRDLFREMVYATDIKTVVFTGSGGNFCSGGDVHEIIGPLVKMEMPELLQFTRMTGDLVKAMRACPQPIISAIDGVCTGAGAMIACGSDMRIATARSKLAFLFVRVGLAGADMGACTLLPRLIGLSRAADLLYTGRVVGGEEAERFGFYNRLVEPDALLGAERRRWPPSLADGPTFGHMMTKTMLWQEWNAGLGECIEAEAQAQAICMADEGLRARLPRVRGQAKAGVRRQLRHATPHRRPEDDMAPQLSEWPFFDDAHRAYQAELERWVAQALPHLLEHDETDLDTVHACVAGWCASWAVPACCAPACRRLRWPARAGGRAQPGSGARDAGPGFGPGRLRAGDAGPGQRAGEPVRQPAQQQALLPGVAAVSTLPRSPCPSPMPARTWPP